jgi:hypothetical protein
MRLDVAGDSVKRLRVRQLSTELVVADEDEIVTPP